jgi:hypothetical protein
VKAQLTIFFLLGGLGVEDQQNGLREMKVLPHVIFFGVCAKEKVYHRQPRTLSELEQQILYAFFALSLDVCFEPFRLSGCLTAWKMNVSVLWVIEQRGVLWHRRFRTTYLSHLQGSRHFYSDILTLKIGPICRPETSVLEHLTPHNNPEDGII